VLRQYFRLRRRCGEHVSLHTPREHFAALWQALIAEMTAE
jgi:hypothetical protein